MNVGRSRRIRTTFQGGPSSVARLGLFAEGWQTNAGEIGVVPPPPPTHTPRAPFFSYSNAGEGHRRGGGSEVRH